MDHYSFPKPAKWLTCLLLSVLISAQLGAQPLEAGDDFVPYIFLNANLQGGLPVQAFQRTGQTESYGGGGLFLVQVGRRPIFAGLEASMMRFDQEAVSYEEVIGGSVEEFEETTKNNAFLAHVVVRAQPWDNSLFRPYLDGLFGVKDLFTRTTVQNVNTEDAESDTNVKDWSLSYGFALGLQLGFFRNKAVTIDLRCSVLTGNNTTFMVRRPDAAGPFFAPIEAFEERNAPASLLIPQIGVTVDLSTVDYYE